MVPTIHYQMGGIPTNIHGQGGGAQGRQSEQRGGRASTRWGECSCVQRARRQPAGHQLAAGPAGPSGRAAGNPHRRQRAEGEEPQGSAGPTPPDRSLETPGAAGLGPPAANTRRDVRQRHPQQHAEACGRLPHPGQHGPRAWPRSPSCAKRSKSIGLGDKSKIFNTARIEALEVENLIEARAGDDRQRRRPPREPRRAHGQRLRRQPAVFPNGRNDGEWMKHTLWFSEGNRLAYKPVNLKPLTVESIPPKVRSF